jgi:DNA-binding HxlR family transcriptional regulator
VAHVQDASIGDYPAATSGPDLTGEPVARRSWAGEQALTILATPLNFMILRALAEQPMRLADLRRATGLPAQTTLRGHLASLEELGVLCKRPTDQMPYAVENALTPMGHELLDVAAALERWLSRAPDGPVALDTGAGKGMVKALVDGWGSTIMRRLGSAQMSLTELDRLIPELSYPALERRLSSMRMAGLIEARESTGAGTPYAVTDWARRGVVPLVAASKCERIHLQAQASPITQADIEAAFLMATPLVGLPLSASGTCQLEVEADPIDARGQAGISVTVERGRVVYCNSELGAAPGDFAVGSAQTWFTAIRDGTASLLRFGGNRRIAEGVVVALHAAMIIQ